MMILGTDPICKKDNWYKNLGKVIWNQFNKRFRFHESAEYQVKIDI